MINADTSASYSTISSNGSFTAASCTVLLSENGTVSLVGSEGMTLYLNSGGTVMHGAVNGVNGAAGLYTALKRTSSYSQTDAAGSWNVNIVVSGPGAPWWERGTITVDGSGNFTGTSVDLFGNEGYLSVGGTLSLSSDGLVTLPSFTTMQGTMDSHKNVMIWTDRWLNGTIELAVLTRRSESYAEEDLTGTWTFSTMSTGERSSVASGTMTVSAGGLAVIRSGSSLNSRKLILSDSGTITIDGFPDVKGSLDAGKTVMIFTERLMVSGLISGSAMTVFTRQ
jgi:hypothetical protein